MNDRAVSEPAPLERFEQGHVSRAGGNQHNVQQGQHNVQQGL